LSILDLPTARAFLPLVAPTRYKAVKGGRGSGKSHFVAELLIEDAMAEPGQSGEGLRAICMREVQKDLMQSSKALIEAKLSAHGITEADGFKVFKDVIQLPGDGVMIFKGMQDYTADSIKSLEGFKRSWWEEAHTATAHSLNMLRPTMRASGSQLIFSWNPRHKRDAIEQMFCGPVKPTGTVLVTANWRDNPWFTPELEQERQDCLLMQPDQYANIWEGDYVSVMSGAYFAAHITKAKAEGRIGRVAADPLLTVRLFADIGGTGGKADNFVFWAVQFVGREIRVIDHYEKQGQPIEAHLIWLRERGYVPGKAQIWLPHDGDTQDKVFDVSYRSAFEAAGYSVEVVPNQGKGAAMMRVEALRRVFSSMWINEATTQDGMEAIGWYHHKREEKRDVDLGPDHDWSSHSADALGLMAVAYELPSARPTEIKYPNRRNA
jgi:phage terminase large subunit